MNLARCLHRLALVVFAAWLSAAPNARAIIRTWIGGTDNYWSTPSNWSPAGAPQYGDDLVFDNSPGANMTNDIPAPSFRTLQFNHSGAVWGQTLSVTVGILAYPAESGPLVMNISVLTLGGNISITSDDGTGWGYTLNCATFLNGHTLTVNSLNSGNVAFQAPIYGTGQLNFAGGINYLSFVRTFGTNGPITAPVRVTSGALELDCVTSIGAIASQLEIDSGATVDLLDDYQIAGGATVAVTGGGQLLLNGRTDGIGSLVMSNSPADTVASSVDTGAGGLLGLNGGVTSWNDSGNVTPILKGRVNLNGFIPFYTGGAVYAGLDLPAELGGAGGFSKAGNSALLLHGSSTFGGGVEVDQGILDVNGVTALGNTSGVLLYGSGSMSLRTSISGIALTVEGNQPITPETSGSLLTALGLGTLSWGGPIVLETNLVVAGGDMILSGAISGPGGLDLRTTGTVQLAGTSGNSYAGTTLVRCQLLEFNKPSGVNAYSGPLVVGGGAGPTCEARWLVDYQNVYATATLFANGFLNLNNHNEDFGAVTFNGGEVDSGAAGHLVIYAPLTVNPAATSAVINGNLGLNDSADRVFIVNQGSSTSDLIINALIYAGGTHYFVKQGAGKMSLTAANTFADVTLLEAGTLEVNNSSGLGSAGVVIFDGATLQVDGSFFPTLANGLEVVGAGVGGTQGALEAVGYGGNVALTGPILLDATTTVNVDEGAGLELQGAISGTGPLIKIGSGTLSLDGTPGNSYAGDTIVSSGELILAKPGFTTAVPGNLVLGPASAFAPALAQFNATGPVAGNTITVNGNSSLNLNGNNQVIAQLNLNDGGSVQTGSGTLGFSSGGVVNVGSQSSSGSHAGSAIYGNVGITPNDLLTFNVGAYASGILFPSGPELDVQAIVFANGPERIGFAPAGIGKTGSGRMRLGANNTYKGRTAVNGGTLQVDGSQPQGFAVVNSGGQLQGSGAVGPVYLNGSSAVVRPGDGPGILNSGNLDAGGGSGVLAVELNGTTPGSGYDQLNVQGTVTLSGVTLSASLNYASSVGDQFVIINNDGTDPVVGTFNGLAQNGTLYVGGQLFQINYAGGTGNDVVLTRLITPPSPVLAIENVPPASVRLLWQTNDPAFLLQFNADLTTNNWITATSSPVVVGTNFVVTNSTSGAQNYYRLARP